MARGSHSGLGDPGIRLGRLPILVGPAANGTDDPARPSTPQDGLIIALVPSMMIWFCANREADGEVVKLIFLGFPLTANHIQS